MTLHKRYIVVTNQGILEIANMAVNAETGSCIVLTDKKLDMLQVLYMVLANSRISFKRIYDGVVFDGRTISVLEYSSSTWGVFVDQSVSVVFINKADLLHGKIRDRIIEDSECKVIMTTRTIIGDGRFERMLPPQK